MEFSTNSLQSWFTSSDAASWSMPEFLDIYTLHDSHLMVWRTISVPSHSTVILIDWDLVWNSAVPPSFYHLLTRFPVLYRTDWKEGSWQDTTIADAESAKLSDNERIVLLEDNRHCARAYQGDDAWPLAIQHPAMDEAVTRTHVLGISWFKLELLPSALAQFVCVNDNGDLFRLPQAKPTK